MVYSILGSKRSDTVKGASKAPYLYLGGMKAGVAVKSIQLDGGKKCFDCKRVTGCFDNQIARKTDYFTFLFTFLISIYLCWSRSSSLQFMVTNNIRQILFIEACGSLQVAYTHLALRGR